MDQKAPPPSTRAPLVDASNRFRNPASPKSTQREESMGEQHYLTSPQPMSIVTSPASHKGKRDQNCLSPATNSQDAYKRNSSVSAASTVSNQGKRKTHVGPWHLGKTLGRGATGRVRLAKHAVTGQTAAIKIVSKRSAAMVQSDSIGRMDQPIGQYTGTGLRQMPSGIEREVVIMKLIEHPNVVRLYDVWENRGELYLVLEYVEGGELFDYVFAYGPLEEPEAVRLFRQIIAGLGYCHRFNICHRDLKPENILLDREGNVKLADFGMAALQPAGRWLITSCGSPHYAAPEIIGGLRYRGDRADVWSCGIILFVLLTGTLPFDGGNLTTTLELVKKGIYLIPQELSDDAKDLIRRILQKKPGNRISMQAIWAHPLLKKYEGNDQAMQNPYVGPAPRLSNHEYGPRIESREAIEHDILRNLQTLWHDVDEETLIERILGSKPTHERMFYNALVRFRNEQVENYQGQTLEYSASDYHHISRGPGWPSTQRNATRSRGSRRRGQVPMGRSSHTRSSSVQEPKSCGTVGSYDPFRSPNYRPARQAIQTAQTTIHKEAPSTVDDKQEMNKGEKPNVVVEEFEDECPPSSPFAVVRNKRTKVSSVKSFQSKTSHAGSRRPLHGATAPRSVSYKRNVCFRHARNRSQGSSIIKAKSSRVNASVPKKESSEESVYSVDNGPFADRESSPLLPAQPAVVRGADVAIKTCAPQKKVHESDFIWKEDTRQVSHELSQICEEAFNGGSLSTGCTTSTCTGSETPATSISMASPEGSHNRIAVYSSNPATGQCGSAEPSTTSKAAELVERRRMLIANSTEGGSEEIPGYLIPVIKHLDRLIKEEQQKQREKSNVDASTRMLDESLNAAYEAAGLPIISEEQNLNPGITNKKQYHSATVQPTVGRSSGSIGKRTVRMVPQSSFQSVDAVRPLTIRKKSQDSTNEELQRLLNEDTGFDSGSNVTPRFSSLNSRHSRNPCELAPIAEIPPKSEKRYATQNTENKKWSWLPLRSPISTDHSKQSAKHTKPLQPSTATVIIHEVTDTPITQPVGDNARQKTPRTKHRGGIFRKLMKKANKDTPSQTTEAPDTKPSPSTPTNSNNSMPDVKINKPLPRRPRRGGGSVNWFARMFQIKPATRPIALKTSMVKGRKEVYKILKEWKEYGLEYVYLDKANSTIHGKVSERNVLRLHPVEFSAEFYTVLREKQEANLSLVYFRQERGAASSFNKVVDSIYIVMEQRGLLVKHPQTAKEIIRSLEKHPDLSPSTDTCPLSRRS